MAQQGQQHQLWLCRTHSLRSEPSVREEVGLTVRGTNTSDANDIAANGIADTSSHKIDRSMLRNHNERVTHTSSPSICLEAPNFVGYWTGNTPGTMKEYMSMQPEFFSKMQACTSNVTRRHSLASQLQHQFYIGFPFVDHITAPKVCRHLHNPS